MAVTTADIAKRTGLSKMTVSRVLNNHPYVKEETRKRVMEAMQDMGFRPNMMARRFFTGKTQLVGLIIPLEFMFSSFYFKELCQGIMEYLEGCEYDVLLHNSRSARITAENKCIELVKGKLVDGLLVAAPMADDTYPSRLTKDDVPLVVLGEAVNQGEVNRVGIPNRQSVCKAVEQLIGLGHRRIAILTYGSDHVESNERLAGYREALQKKSVPVDESLIVEAKFSRSMAVEETKRLIQANGDVTAIVAANVDMALGAAEAIRSMGRTIPKDISLIAFDDNVELEAHDPPITAIKQFPYTVGYAAAEMLLSILKAGELPVKPFCKLIDTEYIERQSVSVPPSSRRSG